VDVLLIKIAALSGPVSLQKDPAGIPREHPPMAESASPAAVRDHFAGSKGVSGFSRIGM
jgi:hypothetical protein